MNVFCNSKLQTMCGKLCGMFGRHCLLGVIKNEDNCRLRPMAHDSEGLGRPLHSTLTADVQT